MMSKKESAISYLELGQKLVATMLRGTTESSFTLMRGVPANDDKRIEEYLWTEVIKDGKPVQLTLAKDNPLEITLPGVYKFRNDGFDDEQALIDMTVYKRAE
jgi:hypothetical protein